MVGSRPPAAFVRMRTRAPRPAASLGISVVAGGFAEAHQDGGIEGSGANILGRSQHALPVDGTELAARELASKKMFFIGIDEVAKSFDIDGSYFRSQLIHWR